MSNAALTAGDLLRIVGSRSRASRASTRWCFKSGDRSSLPPVVVGALRRRGVGVAMLAMGAMGTDVAIETADVALLGEDLRHLPDILDHARRALATPRARYRDPSR